MDKKREIAVGFIIGIAILMLIALSSFVYAIVSHPASQVMAGTFGIGDFTFNGSLGIRNSVGGIFLYANATSGNVGIGTDNPTALLQLGGASPELRLQDTGAGSPKLSLYALYGSEPRNWSMYVSPGASDGYFRIKDVTAGTDRLVIDTSGNVGIGTTSPGNWRLALKRTDSVNQVLIMDSNAPQTQIVFQTSGADVANIFASSSNEFMLGTTAAGPTIFRSNGIERARFLSSGNLGINTTSPGATLEVKGTMKIFGAWESKSNNVVYQAPTDGFVVDYGGYSPSNSGGSATGYTDGSNPPITIRAFSSVFYSSVPAITMPVRKGDYWKVVNSHGGGAVWWIPLGT